jgi:hypothetical protein
MQEGDPPDQRTGTLRQEAGSLLEVNKNISRKREKLRENISYE